MKNRNKTGDIVKRGIAFGLLLVICSTIALSQQVIFQDDFESYPAGTDLSAKGYIIQGASFSVVQEGSANTGEKYAGSDAAENNLYIKRKFILEAGRTYEWTIATRIEGGFKHRMKVVSLSGHEYGLNELLNDTWQTSSIKFMVLPGEETVYLQFYRWAKTELYLDDFEFIDTEETEPANATTRVSSIIGDNMVLQRNSQVGIWGEDDAGQVITLQGSWGGSASVNTDDQGNWFANIETPEAGGPYELTIKGTDSILFQNIMVGEVWLTSGQSNMQLTLNNSETTDGATETIASSANTNIRYFGVARDVSMEEQDQLSGTWVVSDPSVAGGFSAVSYFFAELLEDSLDIPIGIICAAYGAAKIEAFIDRETLMNFSFVTLPDAYSDPVQKTPTVLYNTMIHPLLGYGIKGALWYQGEANRAQPGEYAQLLPAMINSWRSKFNLGEFPFYMVQLAPFNANTSNFDFWQMQLDAALNIPKTGLVSTLDLGDCSNIHPLKKKEIGHRLGYWALANDYGFDNIHYWSPLCKGFEKNGSDLILHFDHAGTGLVLDQESESQFELAGSDNVFSAARAFMHGNNTIRLESDEVSDPVSVRYLHGNCLAPTLFSQEGLPALMFSTSTIISSGDYTFKGEESPGIFPNPVKDILYFNTGLHDQAVQIHNIHGQLLLESDNQGKIDVSMLRPGIYALKRGIAVNMFIKE